MVHTDKQTLLHLVHEPYCQTIWCTAQWWAPLLGPITQGEGRNCVRTGFPDRSAVEVQYILRIHFSDTAGYTTSTLQLDVYTAATLYCWQWTCSIYCTPLHLYCTSVWVALPVADSISPERFLYKS